ncbi:1,4-dihydroxy-2-naphthoate polyprenyltransferase [Desulfoluna butyratoxydans]|uniref:1,4-dihydroxy-2-naphthoate octaprenyltransferase n=1 Tax=Desulfoluna butyratoxydans TaxID=231438 RepID=A0A4U8YM63_9BACT|nr:1,4-dihydroxy-2-naphthoate polyprenyltransferase [Desulfoluna butyratoxydans]VFQ44249.1 mena: 1 4-dihydroxy-2-naphthoate octaprenyltransferase [Desulfoluna butyratoxydans]
MSVVQTLTASPWFLAIRPKTLPASAAPVIVGTACAMGDNAFAFLPALAALLGAMLLQVAVNLANDYFDNKHGIDSEKRLGPVRVTQSGLIAPNRVLAAMVLCLVLATVTGIYLVARGGLPIVVIGVLCILSTLAYSGGPYPIASNGLGELFAFLFFGPVAVCGTYYVQALTMGPRPLITSIPAGLLVAAIMNVNNLRDIPTDSVAGKRTLAVRMGRGMSSVFCGLLVLIPFFMLPLLFLSGFMGAAGFLALGASPMVLPIIKDLFHTKGPALNETLASTAKLSVVFSLLFSVGLAV